ncbi:MAG: nitrogen regulation protein NR(II) [Gammaproteobacteria bacterium]
MSCRKITSDISALSLLDHLSTAVVVADHDAVILGCNVAAENLLDLSAAKMFGIHLNKLFQGSDELNHLVEKARSEKRAYTDRDLPLTTANMKPILVDCTISPWFEPPSMDYKMIVEFTSVERHQRIQSEEAMLSQNQATAALMKGLAHEVKNPLGGIRGAAQLLEREFGDSQHTEYTQIIIGEVDRLRKLVDRMLGPRGTLTTEPVNVHEVLEHVLQIVVAEHADSVAIQRDYDPSLPELEANRDELIQAFLNLIRNAAQAVAVSNGQVTIKTRAQRSITIANKFHKLVLSVEICDNGPGVDREIAESIFFPMVSGRPEGSGLGLPLSQAIVNRYGGLIAFTSAPGDTVFTVWLPLEASP